MKKYILLILSFSIIGIASINAIDVRGSFLPYHSKYKTARNFSPLQIENLSLWLDSKDESTIELNGSNVSGWLDKSGNGNDAEQSTESDQPLYTSDGILFDGIADRLTVEDSATVRMGAGEFTIIAVVHCTATTNGQRILMKGSGGATGPSFRRYQINTTNDDSQKWLFTIDSDTEGLKEIQTTTTSFDNRMILMGIRDNVETELRIYVDGQSDNTPVNTGVYSSIDENPPTKLGIGSRSTKIDFMDGYIMEILIYKKKLTQAEITNLNDYLSRKWGL